MDPVTLGVMGGSALLQGAGGIYAAYQQRQAQKAQLAANQQAQGAITDAYGKAQGYFDPYQQAGAQGLNQMMTGNFATEVPGQYQSQEMQPQFNPGEFNYQADPGMAYRMKTGQEAIQSGAAASGAGLSGATLKALGKYGQELGSQEYGNAFGRYMDTRKQGGLEYGQRLGQFNKNREFGSGEQQQQYTNRVGQQALRYGQAGDLAGMGERAATNLGTMASTYGSNLAGLYGARGDINAAGAQGRNQIVQGTLGNIGNTAMDAVLMSRK